MRLRPSALLAAVLCGCAAEKGTSPPPPPIDAANLAIVSVQFTQGIQDVPGSLPMLAGRPTVANVMLSRSREGVNLAVPVVLRLFRNARLVYTDTARADGPLSRGTSLAMPAAQFLVPDTVMHGALSWQVEIDPRRTLTDSTRTDNLLPLTGTTALPVDSIAGMSVRVMPVVLSSAGGIIGRVTPATLDGTLLTSRQILPTGGLTATVGDAITVSADFGSAPTGGTRAFWETALATVNAARVISGRPNEFWIGLVPKPADIPYLQYGGMAYIGSLPSDIPLASVAVDPDVAGMEFTSATVAHELGHNFGQSHAPGCGPTPPVNPAYPNQTGDIIDVGFDVLSWATGATRLAPAVASTLADVMSYCKPVWISAYSWRAMYQFRRGALAVPVTRVARSPAILVSGSIAADGAVTLRPLLSADAVVDSDSGDGDVRVDVRDATGGTMASARVRSQALDHADGVRQFLAVLPASGAVRVRTVQASSRNGAVAVRTVAGGTDSVSVRAVSAGVSELRSLNGEAVLVRNSGTGDVLAIGWNGTVRIAHASATPVTVSVGQRGPRQSVLLR